MSSKSENLSQVMERAKLLKDLDDTALSDAILKAIRRAVEANAPRVKACSLEGVVFGSELNLVVKVGFVEGKQSFNLSVDGRVENPPFQTVTTASKW